MNLEHGTMKNRLGMMIGVVVCVLAVSLIALVAVGLVRNARTSPGPAASVGGVAAAGQPLVADVTVSDLSLPPFSLVDQHGERVGNDVFEGRVTVIDFVFTNCPLACPAMTGTMKDLADRLAGTPVRFLSFSLDPERDTPERLRAYGEANGADFARWRFLTGDKATTWRMVREGLMFDIGEDESVPIPLADGTTMYNIRHPVHFVLVGPRGEILSLYNSTEEGAVRALEDRARRGSRMVSAGAEGG